MGRNIFFNNSNHQGERDLIESLIEEVINIYGEEFYYCPRKLIAKDDIYGEDKLSLYDNAFELCLYIKSYDSYNGEGQFLSSIGLQIRDSIKLSLSRRHFYDTLAPYAYIDRPQEGDLIYSKMMKRIFIIKYVNNTEIFYQMGTLQTWELECDVYEYSNERLRTGVTEIDEIETKYSTSNIIQDDMEDFEKQMQDVFADNKEFQEEGDFFIDWDSITPFGINP